MGTGFDLRDDSPAGRYVRERILPLAPAREPVPFRGRMAVGSDPLPFFDELDAALRARDGAIWNVTGPPGSGKTHLARWAAALWGRRFLERPEEHPAVLWVDAGKLRAALQDDRSLTGGPFAFALAAEVPGESPETVARLLSRHRFIAVIDKDEDPDLERWKLELPIGLPPGLRILHVALHDSLGGPSARLELWDREMALLAAHRYRGRDGVALIEALASSAAAPLAAYPPFLAWLLESPAVKAEDVASGSCVLEFLRAVQRAHPGSERAFEGWCEALACGPPAAPRLPAAARKLHLAEPSGARAELGRIFRAYLIAEPMRRGRLEKVIATRLLDDRELSFLARLPWEHEVKAGLLKHARRGEVSGANAINLHWWITRTPLPWPMDLSGYSGLKLPGHPFAEGLEKVGAADSDLSGISLGKPCARSCKLRRSSLRAASLATTRFVECELVETAFELADLTGCVFEQCRFQGLSLAEAMLSGASFSRCTFEKVTFGYTGELDPLRLAGCTLRECDVSRMAPSGFLLKQCVVWDTSFAGLAPRSFLCEDARFTECDFTGFAAPGALLTRAHFTKCLMADVSLHGADLRSARFLEVELQPGPSSRAGHTEDTTRADPMYGSKSGFYAQDLSEGVYSDPDLMRTADLRNTDLRGAAFERTDLFRVDLRGARMDPRLEEKARKMRAFVEE